MIRALLVDDEVLARDGLRSLLLGVSDVEIVGEAGDGSEAVRLLREKRPDVVFLDVQMPGMDGFQVLREVSGIHLPFVVFVTAFDEYAVNAFEVHALDFLLKPVIGWRFFEALDRVRRELSRSTPSETPHRLASLLDALERDRASPHTHLRRIPVNDGRRHLLIRTETIDWIGAAGNYAEVHVGTSSFLIRIPLTQLETRLDPAFFARIHRSRIVNLDRIREILPEWHGDCEVVLTTGTSVRMSRNFRARLLSLLDHHRSR